jgi:hypothetical protein
VFGFGNGAQSLKPEIVGPFRGLHPTFIEYGSDELSDRDHHQAVVGENLTL